MIIHYSSSNFSYKLGNSNAYIRKNLKGFFVDSEATLNFFDNFIFTSIQNTNFLIATSTSEFIVYEITDKVKKALIIKNPKSTINYAFEYVVLNINNMLIKITPNLNFSKLDTESSHKNNIETLKSKMELYECDLHIECNLPILYSIKAQSYHPYGGNMVKEFFFV